MLHPFSPLIQPGSMTYWGCVSEDTAAKAMEAGDDMGRAGSRTTSNSMEELD